ncbi:MAG: hypothetical protein AB3N14_10640 [Flavobacteriaceae bacterium]
MKNWSGAIIAKTHLQHEDWSHADVYVLSRRMNSDEILKANEKRMKKFLEDFGSLLRD